MSVTCHPQRRSMAAILPALMLVIGIGAVTARGAEPSPGSSMTLSWETVDVTLPGVEDVRVFAMVPAEPTAADASVAPGSADPGGFVAAGSFHDPTIGDMTRAVAWASPDGRAWQPLLLDAPPSSYATALVNLEDRPLLIGSTYEVPALRKGGYVPSSILWAREPGADWQTVDAEPEDALVWGAGTAPEGVAVLGRSVPKRGKPSSSLISSMQQPAVWTSLDGAGWMRTLLPTRPKRLAATAVPIRIAAATDGTRLIGGSDSSTGAELLWRSVDGVEWALVDSPEPGPGSYFGGLIGTPRGFALLLLSSEGSGATIWTSPDGLSWDRAYDADVRLQLAAADELALAIGSDRILVSSDGIDWHESSTDAFAGATIMGAGVAPDGSIVVGGRTEDAPLRIWVGRKAAG